MLSQEPLVSIIIPCYNQQLFLSETLNSVKGQVYQNWECIIVNDESTDDSELIAQKYVLMDHRFTYFHKPNEGVSAARNFGIKHSKGEYILPLDGDDKISANYLFEIMNMFVKHPEAKIVSSKAYFFGDKSGPWELKEYKFRDLLFGNMLHCSGVFRRKDYEQTLGYRTNMKYGLEDWDFWVSLLDSNDTVIVLPETSFYYRINLTSRTSSLLEDRKKCRIMKRRVFENNINKYYISFHVLPVSFAYFINRQIYQVHKTINGYITKRDQLQNLRSENYFF